MTTIVLQILINQEHTRSTYHLLRSLIHDMNLTEQVFFITIQHTNTVERIQIRNIQLPQYLSSGYSVVGEREMCYSVYVAHAWLAR